MGRLAVLNQELGTVKQVLTGRVIVFLDTEPPESVGGPAPAYRKHGVPPPRSRERNFSIDNVRLLPSGAPPPPMPVFIHTYLCMYVCIYMHIYVCMYVYTYIHTCYVLNNPPIPSSRCKCFVFCVLFKFCFIKGLTQGPPVVTSLKCPFYFF
jgi:hypothetical protein